ncbi:MAG: PAS domain S-box protein [Candidatus Eremiobacteraeota bacterium]|nr:PAS domain S-box protein [Candidatus Eremiobacteraeota bacterium]
MTRILIAESDASEARSLESLLRAMGYDVALPVFSPGELAAKAAELMPDVILAGIEMSGDLDKAGAALQLAAGYCIPVIFLAASSNGEAFGRVNAEACHGLIEKPFHKEKVSLAIQMALHRKKLEDLSVQQEKRIKEGEARFASYFQLPLLGIAITSPQKGWLEVNDRLCEMLGYSREELCSLTWAELTHPDDLSADVEQFNRLLAGEIDWYSLYKRFIRHDGETVHVDLAVRCVREKDGAVGYFTAILQDITERKIAERALIESEEFLESVVENIPDMLFVKDARELRFVRFNKAGEELLGYERNDLYGKNDYDFFPREEADFFVEKDRAVLAGGQLLDIPEEKIHTRNKGERILHTKKIPIIDKEGRPRFLLGISDDITERKQSEEQIRSSLREKEVLLREIHHRVKNNMQVVSSLLSLQAGNLKDPAVKEVFREAQNRVKTMALVHEKLYKSESLSLVNFSGYLRDFAAFINASYGRSNVTLSVEAESLSFTISTAIPLGLIVHELLSNAMKHAFPGEKKGAVRLALSQSEDGTVTLAVSDNGVGFPCDYDFENPSTLGLQLVSDLASQIQGTFGIYPDAGTKFMVTFKPQKE